MLVLKFAMLWMKQGEIKRHRERQRKSNAPEILRHKALSLRELKRLATQGEEEEEEEQEV
jgi:hypothetical protein